jgi:hypothetical protein
MRLPSPRFLIGAVLVVAICVTVTVLVSNREDAAPPPLTIDCIGGSEKSELMQDPEVMGLLSSRYHLAVNFQPMGSYDQVRLSTEELGTRATDCLWPASASAQNVFEAQHAGEFPEYRAETVLQSPEVIYAGPEGTDALINAGVVTERDGRYFADIRGLLVDYVVPKRHWEELGTLSLRGPVAIQSTDPARSNSGFTLVQLQLNAIATNDVFVSPNVDQARAALPTIRMLYDAQGLQARSSDFGFNNWLLQGGELSAPLYAGYENQIVQYVIKAGENTGAITEQVRMIYPDPTIYSDHPILALTPDGGQLIDAMKDPDIQALAWRKYGFRSGTEVGINNVGDFPNLPLAQQIRNTAAPNAEVTLLLLDCITDATRCAG